MQRRGRKLGARQNLVGAWVTREKGGDGADFVARDVRGRPSDIPRIRAARVSILSNSTEREF